MAMLAMKVDGEKRGGREGKDVKDGRRGEDNCVKYAAGCRENGTEITTGTIGGRHSQPVRQSDTQTAIQTV